MLSIARTMARLAQVSGKRMICDEIHYATVPRCDAKKTCDKTNCEKVCPLKTESAKEVTKTESKDRPDKVSKTESKTKTKPKGRPPYTLATPNAFTSIVYKTKCYYCANFPLVTDCPICGLYL